VNLDYEQKLESELRIICRVTAQLGFVASTLAFGWQFSGHATLEEAPCRELLFQNDLFLKHQ